jgi:hypothetical protein
LAAEKRVSSFSSGVWGTSLINQKNFTGIFAKVAMKASNPSTPIIIKKIILSHTRVVVPSLQNSSPNETGL